MVRIDAMFRRLAVAMWIGVSLGCAPQARPTPPSAPEAEAPEPGVHVDTVRTHVEFLAADAQQGRAPGTEADVRVQAYVEKALTEAGLSPAFGTSFREAFEITDGVRIKPGGHTALDLAGSVIPHHLLPFSTDTAARGPAASKLIFVGHGIARGAPNTGDYERLGKKVAGKIVVALHGAPDDPHLSVADTRPQSKVIAARDHGAVGFVLWDPYSDVPLANHGAVNDLGLPAVAVGAEGSRALLEAFAGAKTKKVEAAATLDPKTVGLEPGKSTRQKATLQTEVEPVLLRTANVAGLLPGDGSTDHVVVVGAHMDHLGMGTQASLAPGERAVHNGADDNASGVAVMLEVCRALAQLDASKRPYDVLCIAFGAEEMGVLGSKHFVANLDPVYAKQVIAMVNFDMVGRMGKDGLIVAGTGTSSVWPDLVEKARGSLTVRTSEDGYGPSDHSSFYEANIPVLHFFTGPHEDYHKPSDDIERLNLQGAAEIGTMAYSLVATMMESRTLPDYKATNRPAQRGGGFRISLGTMPDYAAKVDGVRLSGVREGGPAHKAGLRAGDVIQRLGVREVHNLDDYMAAFGELKAGETIAVVVERKGKPLELELTPSAPNAPGGASH
jgi:hypothetical protein